MGDKLAETSAEAEERVQAKRLYLERLSISKHLEDFHQLWTTDEAVIWSTEPKKTSLEESRVLMGSILPNDINPDIDKFALMLEGEKNSRGDTKMIGLVGTNRWSSNSLGLETGYCLNISYWGCGYATEAFACFLEYFWSLEERKNINLLVAKTHPDNVASQKVLMKCGARKGERLVEVYSRYVDKGVKSDTLCWYFARPGVEIEGKGDGREVKQG